MKALYIVAVALSATAFAGSSLFDDSPVESAGQAPPTHQAAPDLRTPATAPTGPRACNFVPAGSKATQAASLRQAIETVEIQMNQAAAAGNAARRGVLARHRDHFRELLSKSQAEPLLPSLYPLDLGKKGCLFAFRQTECNLGSADQPLAVRLQVISWFRITITAVRSDGSLDAEVRDNTGDTLLYRVCLQGVDTTVLKPGVSANLVNAPFECISEEQTDSGKIYGLKRLPTAALQPM